MFLLACAAAHAYELRLDAAGDPVRWPSFPVSWSTPPATPHESALEAAFRTWEEVEGARVRFERTGDVVAPDVGPDEVNVVFFDPSWPWGEALAMTSAWMTEDGEIVAFDIQIDPDAEWSATGDPDAFDLQAAVTHEIGHGLGIEHSAVEDATMYATHGRGEAWRRELDDDDRAAETFLYPASRPRSQPAGPEPSSDPLDSWFSGSAHCRHAPGALPAALLAAAFVRRRHRPEVR